MNTTTQIAQPLEMPAEMKKNWLAALRSGKYEQGPGKLKTTNGAYCCLGVLQCIVDGDVERFSGTDFDAGNPRAMPTMDWAQANGLSSWIQNTQHETFKNAVMELTVMNDGEDTGEYDDDTDEPIMDNVKTFLQIADHIELTVKGV